MIPVEAGSLSHSLQPLTAALLECVTTEDVISVVVERGIAVLGASAGLVALVTRSGLELEIARTRGYAPEPLNRWLHFPVDGPYPLSDVIRTSLPVYITDRSEWDLRYPSLAHEMEDAFQASVSLPLAAQKKVFGAVHFSFHEPRVITHEERVFLDALSHQCALALARALLTEELQKERQESEDAKVRANAAFLEAEAARLSVEASRSRLEFLARASALLGESLDYGSRLEALARLCVPELADWSGVDILSDSGELVRLAVSHRVPEMESVMRDLQERYPPSREGGSSPLSVVETGERLFYPSISEEMIDQGTAPEQARLLKQIGLQAVLCLPLTTRGRTLGAITLGMAPLPEPVGSGRSFTEETISLAEELSLRAAVALDNASLYRQTQREAAERREAEGRFQFMANSAPVLIWTSATDGGCDWLNESWLHFTGRSMEQELGDGWMEGIHPDDLAHCLKNQSESFEARLPFRNEYRLRRYDGQYRCLLDNGVPLIAPDGTFGGFIGSCVDITEQKSVVERQRRFVRDMLASVTEGKLCLCDSLQDVADPLPPASEILELRSETLRSLRMQARAVAESLHLAKDRIQDLLTAVGEASMNAVRHGGGGTGRVHADPAKKLVQVWIEDRGKGIRQEDLHRATLEKGWSGADSFGHGFFLILRTVDRTYLLTGAEGTTIVLEQGELAPKPAWFSEPS